MDLLEEIQTTGNISLSDPEILRMLLSKLCIYTMSLESKLAATTAEVVNMATRR